LVVLLLADYEVTRLLAELHFSLGTPVLCR
jgi:hypothetical protein